MSVVTIKTTINFEVIFMRTNTKSVNHPKPSKLQNTSSNEIENKVNLYTQVASCLVNEDKFYESGKNANKNLLESIKKVDDTEWILKLATYARNELHLRTVPLVLTSEIALDSNRNKDFGARKYVNAVVQRPDEIPELLAYNKQRCAELGRDKLPQMILKGLTPVWSKFGRYHIAKYRKDDSKFTLRDAMFLTHPMPSDELETTYNELANKTLKLDESTETWESYISEHGSTRENWEHIIDMWIIT